MKQQLEREELVQGLYEVKNLLIAMNNLNAKELQVRGQIRQTIPAQNIQLKQSTKKGGWITLLITAFVVMTLFFALCSAPKAMSESERLYEEAVINDKFAWRMEGNAQETYPGYRGSVEEPITFGTAYMRALPKTGITSLVLVVIVGAVIFSIQRSHNAAVEKENKKRTKQYQAVLEQNNQIMANNQRVQAEIQAFHERKRQISREYLTDTCRWFHEEYAFMEAVEFFIHELELGTATTLPEAIKNFREYEFRKQVIENQKTMIDNQKIMINNQEIMISNQEEMIRQQMIGNFIAAATWMETRSIANSARSIEANTSATARYAGEAASAANKTADATSNIAYNTRHR